MLAAPTHPDLPNLLTQLLSRSIYLSSHGKNMAEPSCSRSAIGKSIHQGRRRRSRSPQSAPRRHASLLSDGKLPNDTRGRPPNRAGSAEDLCWASSLRSSLPTYDPKPLLRREDAFKVVEEAAAEPALCPGPESDDSTEYDSDELEFCTTQFPEFEEGCIYEFRP